MDNFSVLNTKPVGSILFPELPIVVSNDCSYVLIMPTLLIDSCLVLFFLAAKGSGIATAEAVFDTVRSTLSMASRSELN